MKIKDDGDDLGSSKNLRGILGYELHPNLAVEGLLSVGVSDGHATIQGIREDTRVDHVMGLYLKPKLAVTPGLEVFGRVGYARAKTTNSLLGMSESVSSSDMSYGVGLAYRINDRLSAVVDYTLYSNKDNTKLQGLSAGLRWGF